MKTKLEMLTELRDELNRQIANCAPVPECTGIVFLSTADGSRSVITLSLRDPSLETAYKYMTECYLRNPVRDVTELAKL